MVALVIVSHKERMLEAEEEAEEEKRRLNEEEAARILQSVPVAAAPMSADAAPKSAEPPSPPSSPAESAPRGAHELTLGFRALLVGAAACLVLGALAGAAVGYGTGVRHSPAPRRVVVSERLLALVSPPEDAGAARAEPPWRRSERRRAGLAPRTPVALVR